MEQVYNKRKYISQVQILEGTGIPNSSFIALLYDFSLISIGVLYLIFSWFSTKYAFPHIPLCPFYLLTHTYCPLCGMTRAFGQLLHGNFGRAMSFNSLAIPLFILWVLFIIYSVFVFMRDVGNIKRALI